MTEADFLKYRLRQIIAGDRFLGDGDVQDEIVALMMRYAQDSAGVVSEAKLAFVSVKEQELATLQSDSATLAKILSDIKDVKP